MIIIILLWQYVNECCIRVYRPCLTKLFLACIRWACPQGACFVVPQCVLLRVYFRVQKKVR